MRAMRSIGPRGGIGGPISRLGFVDGLRGLAALYVVMHHAALLIPPAELGLPASVARFLLRHGHYAVTAFIVLSGYGLMHRALAEQGGRLPGGMLAYLGRRARRILPPYYAALALCWILIATVPALGRPSGTPWDRALPAFGPGAVVSHLLLIHNLDGRWIFRVAPPFWSLATAWQTCLLFPPLLWLHRRRGPAAVLAAGFGLGAAVELLAIPLGNPALRALCPWYFGLFALGMAGAASVHKGRRVARDAISPALALIATAWVGDGYLAATDVLAGAAVVGLVVRLADGVASPARVAALGLLGSRPARWLGAHSYSLYLTHFPMLALVNLGLLRAGWGPDARLAALAMMAVPACIAISVPFRALFERGQVVGLWSAPGRGLHRGLGSRIAAPGLR